MKETMHYIYIAEYKIPLGYNSFGQPRGRRARILSALESQLEFEDWLKDTLGSDDLYYESCHHDDFSAAIKQYLIVSSKRRKWEEYPGAVFRPAKKEIFMSRNMIYYASRNSIQALHGQLLKNWYGAYHGMHIPNINNDITRRTKLWGIKACQNLGLSGPLIHQHVIPTWQKEFDTASPEQLTTELLTKELNKVISAIYEHNDTAPASWYVQEIMVGPDEPISPLSVDGMSVLEAHEAIPEQSGAYQTIERLIRASRVFQMARTMDPEMAVLRPLQKGEVFAAEQGTAWMQNEAVVWFDGEIANDLVSRYHGETVHDLAERVWDQMHEMLLSKAEEKGLILENDEDFSRAVEEAHAMLGDEHHQKWWFEDLDRMAFLLKTKAETSPDDP